MFLIIDLTAMALSLVCAGAIWYIYRLVGGRGRVLMALGFTWLAIVRFFGLLDDLGVRPFPTKQMGMPFYALLSVGLVMMVLEIRRALKRR